jgi:hypothetical protein
MIYGKWHQKKYPGRVKISLQPENRISPARPACLITPHTMQDATPFETAHPLSMFDELSQQILRRFHISISNNVIIIRGAAWSRAELNF